MQVILFFKVTENRQWQWPLNNNIEKNLRVPFDGRHAGRGDHWRARHVLREKTHGLTTTTSDDERRPATAAAVSHAAGAARPPEIANAISSPI